MAESFTTTLLIPTLNEAAGLRVIMPRIEPSWVDQILFVDGGSTDGTMEWLRAHHHEVVVQERPGLRHAYDAAWPHIRGDVVITYAPDGNCIPEDIPKLKAKIAEGYDLVLGSRYLSPAHSDDDDAFTGFGNWLFTRTVNLLHGAAYTDALNMFRAFRRDVVERLELAAEKNYALPERLFRTVVSWEPLMAVRAAKANLRVCEVPSSEPARIAGARKLQMWRWGAVYYFQFWRELFFWKPRGEGKFGARRS